MTTGPLQGIKIIELAGIGPSPYTCMLLADAGAQILRVDRPQGPSSSGLVGAHWDLMNRSRRSVAIDLKHEKGASLILDLVEKADALVEGWRPGVAERLGVGPEQCLARNPRLVYGRMTGWGQDGPMAEMAGHDINYIALSGALWSIGRQDDIPVPPLNLVGDFGGGGMMLAFGMCAALVHAKTSGRGQVVDAAMVDGAASLMTMTYALHLAGIWNEERGANMLDTGAPYYDVYETSDGKWFAIGAIERQFYAEMIRILGLEEQELPNQNDREQWPIMKKRFAEIFRTKTRDEWAALFDRTDACGAPVLSPWEAHEHPHNKTRGTFVEVDGVVQPAPAPRFSATPSQISSPPHVAGQDTDEALMSWGVSADQVSELREQGVVG